MDSALKVHQDQNVSELTLISHIPSLVYKSMAVH